MALHTPSKGNSTSNLIIPDEVLSIIKKLHGAGHKAYPVGGCVRDALLGITPSDWDITTDAKPEEVQKIFPDSFYENAFGTVGVKTESENSTLKVIEITTFRIEGRYSDARHPDEIKFAETVEEDLSRRDFTVNAIALGVAERTAPKTDANLRIDANNANKKMLELVDPHHGERDLKAEIIRAVGDPEKRFTEDALRLMRAVRLAAQLGFEIEELTSAAIVKHAGLLEMIAKERIRDEFSKLLMAKDAMRGIQLLEDLNLLRYVMPELREGIGVGQNLHHIYSVWEHNLRALDYSAKKNYSLMVRMASLLHDVGKPRAKRGEGKNSTFYAHDVVGARMTAKILDRLRYSKNFIEQVAHLVRHHLFYYNVGEVTAAGVRRFLARVGPENLDDLFKIREADRIGSGVPKAVPYKARHLMFMIEKVRRDPVSPRMLALKGDEVMKIASISPSPKVGFILSLLLEEVLDDPKKNKKEYLATRVTELAGESDKALAALAKKAREKKDEFEAGAEAEMKKQFYVQ